jgi:hypothetical protein
MTPMKTISPTAQIVAFVNDLKAAIGRHKHLTPQEMLAGAAQLVGNLVALQDQRKMTPAMALEVVQANIEVGNQASMAEVSAVAGSKN